MKSDDHWPVDPKGAVRSVADGIRARTLGIGFTAVFGALIAASSLPARAETITLKVATYVTPKHGMSIWLENWAKSLEEKSSGRLKFEILHGAQLGPPPKYYDIARNGQADITWVLHGATPGRFELTEISNMPFMFCSATQATRVLNHPELRASFLDPEHRGVRVLMLFAHPPGHVNMAEGSVRSVEDFSGKALRPASSAVGEFITALGARPVGLPPTAMAESLQKKTIDGAFIDYGGGALAFQLGPHLKSVTEVGAYTTSFGLVMNPKSYDKLPDDLKQMIDASFVGKEDEVAGEWEKLDTIGKAVYQKAGVAIVTMSAAEAAKFKAIGDKVTADYIARLARQGKPATEVAALMKKLIEDVGSVGPGCR